MIPLRDENPTRVRPVVTLVLIGLCCFVYFFLQKGLAEPAAFQNDQTKVLDDLRFSLHYAAIPKEVVHNDPIDRIEVANDYAEGDPRVPALACDASTPNEPSNDCYPDKPIYLTVLFSMFLHGSLLHLGGNMLFLWVFGNNIEDQRGPPRYLLFYLLAGLAAMAAHVLIDPGSTVPVVGASGAIAGVMGAYLVLFPNAPIHTLLVLGFFITWRPITAKWLLGFWFVSQFFISPNAGVAWAAHVGGFVFGVVAALIWRATGGVKPRPEIARPRPAF